MKPITIAAIIFGMAFTATADEKKANELIQAAQAKETVQGDLKAAIGLYGQAVKEAGSNRGLAVKSLLRLAECYQKMGDAEARKIYQQVVRDYSDQKEAVAEARVRMGKISLTSDPTSRSLWRYSGPTNTPQAAPYFGAVSPDGRYISYSDRRDLFLHEIATGQERNLTNQEKDSKDEVDESVISPDGKRVAYIWKSQQNNRYELRIANLSGDPNRRRLFDNPEVQDLWLDDWSPDGRLLAVVLARKDRTRQIGLISVEGGSMLVLKSGDWRSVGDSSVHFSPDSKFVGYDRVESERTRNSDVYVLAVDGSSEFPVAVGPGDDTMVGWTPDGKWIVFAGDRVGGRDLYAVAFMNGKPQGAPRRVMSNISNDPNRYFSFRPLGWSSSGAFYYSTRTERTSQRLAQGSIDFTAGKFSLVELSYTDQHEFIRDSVLSRDGKFAYTSFVNSRGAENNKLRIRSVDAENVREIRPSVFDNFNLIGWMPDGRSVLVNGRDLGFVHSGLYRIDTETGNVSTILAQLSPSSADTVSLMPDGDSFLVEMSGSDDPSGATGVFRVNTWTGERSIVFLELTGESSRSFKPSRDGNRFFMIRSFPAPGQHAARETAIIERDLGTGAEKQLLRLPGLDGIEVSADGRSIVTSSTDPVSNLIRVLAIPVSGGEPRELMRATHLQKGVAAATTFQQTLEVLGETPDRSSVLVYKSATEIRDHPGPWVSKAPELWSVSLNGEAPKKIDGAFDGTFGRAHLSSDGRHFLVPVTRQDPTSVEVLALENFLPRAVMGGN